MDDVESELIDEEIIHLILEKKVSEISTVSEKIHEGSIILGNIQRNRNDNKKIICKYYPLDVKFLHRIVYLL